jgi:hypothetical protein
MATVKQVLDTEREWIGYSRFNDPEQGTVFGRWYAEVVNDSYFAGNGVPYCVMFQSYCFNSAGQTEPFFPAASCDVVKARAMKSNQIVNINDVTAGDLFLFDWGDGGILDHIGICESVVGDGTYQTIEGNTKGGKVDRRYRSSRDIRYVVRPNYDKEIRNGIVVDGLWGEETTLGLRKILDLPLSKTVHSQWVGWRDNLQGCISPCWEFSDVANGDELIAALQKYLRYIKLYNGDIDGICGVNTINGLETWMNVKPDNVLSSPSTTIARLQSMCNSGDLI